MGGGLSLSIYLSLSLPLSLSPPSPSHSFLPASYMRQDRTGTGQRRGLTHNHAPCPCCTCRLNFTCLLPALLPFSLYQSSSVYINLSLIVREGENMTCLCWHDGLSAQKRQWRQNSRQVTIEITIVDYSCFLLHVCVFHYCCCAVCMILCMA